MSLHHTSNGSTTPGISYEEALTAVLLRSKIFLNKHPEVEAEDVELVQYKLIANLAIQYFTKNGEPLQDLIISELKRWAIENKGDHQKLKDNLATARDLLRKAGTKETIKRLRLYVEGRYLDEKKKRKASALIAAVDFYKGDIRRKISQLADGFTEIHALGFKGPEVQPSVYARPMPEEAYHGILGDYVRAWVDITAVNPEPILLQALVLAGNALAQNDAPLRRPHFYVARTYHPTVLYGLVIGPSSTGAKGQGYDIARAPFEHLGDENVYNADEQIVDGVGSGQQVIHLVKDESQRFNKRKGEMETIPGAEHKNVTVFEKEFAGPLRLDSSPGSILTVTYRSLWDAGRTSNNVKGSPAVATNARVSMIAHITPAELRELVKAVDMLNGFYNRFLFVESYLKVTDENRYGSLPLLTLGRYGKKLGQKLKAAQSFGEMEIAVNAKDYWDKRALSARLFPRGEDRFSVLMARSRALVLRAALIFAALDGAREIQKEHIEAALAIHEHSASVAYKAFIGSPATNPEVEHDTVKRFITEQLKYGPKPLSFFTHGRRDTDKYKAALNELLSARKIVLNKIKAGEKGGPPTTMFELAPVVKV